METTVRKRCVVSVQWWFLSIEQINTSQECEKSADPALGQVNRQGDLLRASSSYFLTFTDSLECVAVISWKWRGTKCLSSLHLELAVQFFWIPFTSQPLCFSDLNYH